MAKKNSKRADQGGNGAPVGRPYFLSLSLENVRCFGEKQTLKLRDEQGRPARWTIILGDNGTGKMTLLRTLAAIPYFLWPHDLPSEGHVLQPKVTRAWLSRVGDSRYLE